MADRLCESMKLSMDEVASSLIGNENLREQIDSLHYGNENTERYS